MRPCVQAQPKTLLVFCRLHEGSIVGSYGCCSRPIALHLKDCAMGCGASSRISVYASKSEQAALEHMNRGGSLYAVAVGRMPGIYATWKACQQQTEGFKDSLFQSFNGPTAMDDSRAFTEKNCLDLDTRPRRWSENEFVELHRVREEGEREEGEREEDDEGERLRQFGERAQPTAEECSRHGITIEGIEHFLAQHGDQIGEGDSVLDVAHRVIMPLTVPVGWKDVVTAAGAADPQSFTHKYCHKQHPPAHAAARRLRGWEHTHPSGLTRGAWVAKSLMASLVQRHAPADTRSYCAQLLAERREALEPLRCVPWVNSLAVRPRCMGYDRVHLATWAVVLLCRHILFDLPYMRLKEVATAKAELPRQQARLEREQVRCKQQLSMQRNWLTLACCLV